VGRKQIRINTISAGTSVLSFFELNLIACSLRFYVTLIVPWRCLSSLNHRECCQCTTYVLDICQENHMKDVTYGPCSACLLKIFMFCFMLVLLMVAQSWLQVWRVSGQEKILLPASNQSKLYSGDCYIFQYSYPGEDKEEYLIGAWFGKQSVEVKLF
jgi:hypothetical protein